MNQTERSQKKKKVFEHQLTSSSCIYSAVSCLSLSLTILFVATKMYSVLLCCAALLAVSSALPTGAPDLTCDSLMPGGPHVANGNMEQATINPWTIDVCNFDEIMGFYTYTPGMTYNSKCVVTLMSLK